LVVGGGALLYFGSTMAIYAMRAMRKMEEERIRNEGGSVGMDVEEENEAEGAGSPRRTQRLNTIDECLGLDLGSSFSKITHMEKKESRMFVEVLENREGRRVVATAVTNLNDELACGQLARAARFSTPKKTIFGTPILLGVEEGSLQEAALVESIFKSFPFAFAAKGKITLGNNAGSNSIKQLNTLLFKDLVSAASAKLGAARQLPPAIVSHPNFFNAESQAALLAACREAGVEAVSLVPDGVSAYISFVESASTSSSSSSRQLPPSQAATVAVLDIGGRITQMSLLHVEHDEQRRAGFAVRMLKEKTLFDVGGDFFDEALVEHLASKFAQQNNINLLQDEQAKQRLFDAAETAKVSLSSQKSTEISIPFITATQKGPLHLTVAVSRSTLDSLLEPKVIKLKAAFTKILMDPSEATAPLAQIVICGGGSRMAFVRTLVMEATGGLVPCKIEEPEMACAIGAAAFADHL